MERKVILRRVAAVLALGALLVPEFMAYAKTSVTDLDMQVNGVTIRVMAGSTYKSLTPGDTTLVAELEAGQALFLRTLGDNRRALENDAQVEACNVLRSKQNQVIFVGPRTVTVTPGENTCNDNDASDDRTNMLDVSTPNGGEKWKSGQTVQLFWANEGQSAPSVRIELLRDANEAPTVITESSDNSGFYQWTVPAMATASHARVRIVAMEGGSPVAVDVSNGEFSIEGTTAEGNAPPTGTDTPDTSQFAPYDAEDATLAATTIDFDRAFPEEPYVDGQIRCTAGTRIKGPSSSAVYYCGRDGKRHGFPNQRIHDSWYQNFDGVVTLTDAQLAGVPLGKNVTYRPGVRLIKLQTDPKTYAVAANGTLRWVPDEWTAKRLYGDDWGKKVDDVSDAFFTDYVTGSPVPTSGN